MYSVHHGLTDDGLARNFFARANIEAGALNMTFFGENIAGILAFFAGIAVKITGLPEKKAGDANNETFGPWGRLKNGVLKGIMPECVNDGTHGPDTSCERCRPW